MKENLRNLLMRLVHDDQLPYSMAERIADAAGVELDTCLVQLNKSILGVYQAYDLLNQQQSLSDREETLFSELVNFIEGRMFTKMEVSSYAE